MENTPQITTYLESVLTHFDYSKSKLANNMNLNYQTLMSRFKSNRILGIDLVLMAKIFDFNKKQVEIGELPQIRVNSIPTVSLSEEERYPAYEKGFVLRIESILKQAKETKKELAEYLGYGYSQIINRFTNASFTATDLMMIMDKYGVDFNSFITMRPKFNVVEECDYEDENLIDFSKVDINARENFGVNEMKNYMNGGFTVDEKHLNGYHLYIPYGVSVDLMDSLGDSIRAIQLQTGMTQGTIQSVKNQLDNLSEDNLDTRKQLESIIEVQERNIAVQQNTIPILNMLINSIRSV